MLLTICCLAGMLLIGCGHAAGGAAPPPGPQKITLRVGQEAKVKGSDVRVKFLSVDNDSRCPEGVNCIWAGSVGVSLMLSARGAEGQRLKLNTATEPQTATFKGYVLKIDSVRPPRVEGKKIEPGGYVITLSVCSEKSAGKTGVPCPASPGGAANQ